MTGPFPTFPPGEQTRGREDTEPGEVGASATWNDQKWTWSPQAAGVGCPPSPLGERCSSSQWPREHKGSKGSSWLGLRSVWVSSTLKQVTIALPPCTVTQPTARTPEWPALQPHHLTGSQRPFTRGYIQRARSAPRKHGFSYHLRTILGSIHFLGVRGQLLATDES